MIKTLRHRWLMMVVIVGVATAGTWAYCELIASPVYRSTISLIFRHPEANGANQGISPEAFAGVQREIVLTDQVLARTKVIAEDEAMRDEWLAVRDAREKASGDEQMAQARGDFEQFLRGRVGERVKRLLTESHANLDDDRHSIEISAARGAGSADGMTLTVDRPGARGEPEPHKTAKYTADVLADMYIVRFEELQQELSAPTARVMGDVVSEYETYVKQKLAEYDAFVQKNAADVNTLEEMLKSGTGDGSPGLLGVREKETELGIALSRDRALFEVVKKALPPKALEPGGIDALAVSEMKAAVEKTPVDFVQSNPGILEIQKHAGQLAAKRAALETQFTEASREMRDVNDEIARVTRNILTEIVSQARRLSASIEARSGQLDMNRELLVKNEEEQGQINQKFIAYARLKNDFEVAEKHLASLRQEQSQAVSNALQARQALTIHKAGEATTPDSARPIYPRTGWYTFLAFVISTLAGGLIAALLDRMDRSFHSVSEAEAVLGLPVLGSVARQPNGLVVIS